jgi:hypothetical protein
MPDIRKSKENDQNIKFKMFFYAEIKKSIFFDLIRKEDVNRCRISLQSVSLNKLAAKLPHRKENKKRSNVM